MKVTLVVATSLDGKITMGDNPDVHTWTSPEDSKFFRSKLEKSNLIVMGRGTYEVMKFSMKHIQGRIRVILTHTPEKYKAEEMPEQLEFTDESPKELIQRLSKKGYKNMLLVSGATVTTEFFKANLVDEIYLTLEPWIFGAGKSVVLLETLNTKLKLLNIEKLNPNGTLLLKYSVQHDS